MDRVVITVHPTASDESLLSVADAMQQVLDSIKLLENAHDATVDPRERFEWKLESASTNSPFTVIAVAQPTNPTVDISAAVRRVKTEVSTGIRNLVQSGIPAAWMSQGSVAVAKNIFARTLNGVGETDISFSDDDILAIRREQADSGFRAISALNVMSFDFELEARTAYGEIQGVMLAAGRYRNREAIQIRNDPYGFIWCTLSKEVIDRYGSSRPMSEVWAGKTLGVEGRLIYAAGGKLNQIEAVQIREIETVPLVDLESILDPNFTAGMDPYEYLDKLHEGHLA